jgi:hypothetical protein
MKLVFDYNPERHEISFMGDGFRISNVAANYEDIGEFAKQVIEHDILIPKLKHRNHNVDKIYYLFQDCDCKHWFRDNADMLQLAEYLDKKGCLVKTPPTQKGEDD